MKYTACQYLHGGLRLNYNSINVCCSVMAGPILAENCDFNKLNWNEIQQKRLAAIEDFKNGIICDNCKGCIHLKEADWSVSPQINEIFLLHWTHCNCSCVYCVNQYITKGLVTRRPMDSQYYNAYPILKQAIKEGQISKDLTLHCLGGESGVLKEMDKILKLFVEHGLKYVFCVTSGIEYIKRMKDVFKKYDGRIVISLDCGSRETYKKIKRVDKFDAVVSNIKKYIKDANGKLDRIMIKYILTENYNDTKEEIDKFFDLLISLGLKQTRVDIDYRKLFCDQGSEVPKHLLELNEYFRNKASENNIALVQYEVMDKIFEDGHF